MNGRVRRLVGIVMLLVLLLVYIVIAAAIGSGRISEAHWAYQFIYFLVAGLAWVIPAAMLIRWMVKPDQE